MQPEWLCCGLSLRHRKWRWLLEIRNETIYFLWPPTINKAWAQQLWESPAYVSWWRSRADLISGCIPGEQLKSWLIHFVALFQLPRFISPVLQSFVYTALCRKSWIKFPSLPRSLVKCWDSTCAAVPHFPPHEAHMPLVYLCSEEWLAASGWLPSGMCLNVELSRGIGETAVLQGVNAHEESWIRLKMCLQR